MLRLVMPHVGWPDQIFYVCTLDLLAWLFNIFPIFVKLMLETGYNKLKFLMARDLVQIALPISDV